PLASVWALRCREGQGTVWGTSGEGKRRLSLPCGAKQLREPSARGGRGIAGKQQTQGKGRPAVYSHQVGDSAATERRSSGAIGRTHPRQCRNCWCSTVARPRVLIPARHCTETPDANRRKPAALWGPPFRTGFRSQGTLKE